ncbi:3-oxoacyl-[acyl-carrier-protein] reductase [uncultured Tyzzerella sp.]|uniref:3-oxoacyl-[acyl-carrier-protein] reductase n=1 Tax=uncultured Tyzzerella sp. TaxID=2321398 RepID=UPI002943CFFC|nr:3-oxoacyl-[acyl-carrier-protein] reductase [uncultured Tyzzerella sp.]
MLKEKTVIVTGGAKGIGKAIAIAFAKEGANIVLNYRSTSPEDVAKEIESFGVKCLSVQADISDFEQAKQLVDKALEEFKTIDILVNNAGITKDNLLLKMSEDDFDMVINTNLKGAFNMIKHTSKVMLKQKSGSIINMSSVVGLTGNIGQVNYSASKAGMIGMTFSTARELASRGITCNAIAPGFIETDMTDVLPDSIKENILNNIPLKRMGTTDEIASTAVFLAKNKYITGQVITVDGGMVMA